jgi:cold shock protein
VGKINASSETERSSSGGDEPQTHALSGRPHHSENEFNTAPGGLIFSVVKWFDPKRGFGFVVLSDGSGEAFLHRTILSQSGVDVVEACAVLKVRVAPGDPRPKIVEVLGVDRSSLPLTTRDRSTTPVQRVIDEMGLIKLWKAERGYGFITRDGGGADAFFHLSWLHRRKALPLAQGQRVVMDVVDGPKGPKATNIRLILPASGIAD